MAKRAKKAFTIVELVIVIAVIAILMAVLIPTFVSLVKKANVSSDTQLVRNLNTALALDQQEHKTMQAALDAAEESGFDVAKINAKVAENEILWDSKNDVFCYLNGETNQIEYVPNSTTGTPLETGDYRLWKISDTVDTVYSTYLYGYEGTTVTAIKGLDVGKTKGIISVTYTNKGAGQGVVIRTNSASTTLTIFAPNDEITHYDFCGKVYIRAAKGSSYHENGTVAFMEINKGHVEVRTSGSVELMYANPTAYKVENDVIVEDSAEAVLPVVSVTNNGDVDHAHASSETNATNTNSVSTGITFDYDKSTNEFTKADPHGTTVNHEYGTYANDGTNSWTIENAANEAVTNMASKEAEQNAPVSSNPEVEYVAVNVSKLNRMEDGAYYTTLNAAINSAPSGDTIALIKDYTLSSYIDITKACTIDLNGHILDSYYYSDNNCANIAIASTVTIKNGTLNFDGASDAHSALLGSDWYKYDKKYLASLTIDNLTINTSVNGDREKHCYAVFMGADGNQLTINDGKFHGKIGTHGNGKDYKITINGGEFLNSCYFPGAGTYEINGGTFTSVDEPIFYWKSASPLIINAGEFNMAVSDDYNGQWAHYGSGSCGGNAALVVEACNYGGHGNPTVSINKDVKFNINKGAYTGAFYDVLVINYGYTPASGAGGAECVDSSEGNTPNTVNCVGIQIPYRVADGQITGHETTKDNNNQYTEPDDGWYFFNDDNTTLFTPHS